MLLTYLDKSDRDLIFRIYNNFYHLKEKFHNNFRKAFQLWKSSNYALDQSLAQHKDINIVMYLESKN